MWRLYCIESIKERITNYSLLNGRNLYGETEPLGSFLSALRSVQGAAPFAP